MSRITTWIAGLGKNIQFVAFFAHLGVAALVVELIPFHLYAKLAVLVAGAVKEFYFDAKYETDPPQSFADNLEDWFGWAIGAALGYAIA
ncbi:MAG TPA: hypothetical protein VJY15_23290, partial [Candidatus Acidoferrum sp.]|nr:hypothetical protein [Candidatus Acidoferrum sp.]